MSNTISKKLLFGFILGCIAFYLFLNTVCRNKSFNNSKQNQLFGLYCPNVFYFYINHKFSSSIFSSNIIRNELIVHSKNKSYTNRVQDVFSKDIIYRLRLSSNVVAIKELNKKWIKFNNSSKQSISVDNFTIVNRSALSTKKYCKNPPEPFNFKGNDVLVLIHIQKTGGTYFENKLTQYSILDVPCSCFRKKKTVCSCPRYNSDLPNYSRVVAFKEKYTNMRHVLFRKRAAKDINGKLSNKQYLSDENYGDDDDENIDKIMPKNNRFNQNGFQFRNKHIPMWLFARSTYSWKACGLHADLTALKECVPKIISHGIDITNAQNTSFNYRYATILREPVSRYISEYFHVRRGATWRKSLHTCAGRDHELPLCYNSSDPGGDWSQASMQDFLTCPYNLANNRQTRHLADLTKIGCYEHLFGDGRLNGTAYDHLSESLLRSAKDNLKDGLAFFGLLEHQPESQYLLEKMLGIRLKVPLKTSPTSRSDYYKPSVKVEEKIRAVNSLDVRLYQYATRIFFARLAYYRALDSNKDPNTLSCLT